MERAIRMLDSVTGRQMMSLVITTEDGRVIVIDGGYREDAPRLLACLREVTGQDVPHVDAFWLTHPHSDHMHAFMELCEHHADDTYPCVAAASVIAKVTDCFCAEG